MPSPSDTGVADSLPPDVVEDVLADPRRRAALRYLAGHEEPVCVTDLAIAVGAAEASTEPAAVHPEERRQIRDDLYERHLPKLTATGVVEFDSMRGTVTLADESLTQQLS